MARFRVFPQDGSAGDVDGMRDGRLTAYRNDRFSLDTTPSCSPPGNPASYFWSFVFPETNPSLEISVGASPEEGVIEINVPQILHENFGATGDFGSLLRVYDQIGNIHQSALLHNLRLTDAAVQVETGNNEMHCFAPMTYVKNGNSMYIVPGTGETIGYLDLSKVRIGTLEVKQLIDPVQRFHLSVPPRRNENL